MASNRDNNNSSSHSNSSHSWARLNWDRVHSLGLDCGRPVVPLQEVSTYELENLFAGWDR